MYGAGTGLSGRGIASKMACEQASNLGRRRGANWSLKNTAALTEWGLNKPNAELAACSAPAFSRLLAQRRLKSDAESKPLHSKNRKFLAWPHLPPSIIPQLVSRLVPGS